MQHGLVEFSKDKLFIFFCSHTNSALRYTEKHFIKKKNKNDQCKLCEPRGTILDAPASLTTVGIYNHSVVSPPPSPYPAPTSINIYI